LNNDLTKLERRVLAYLGFKGEADDEQISMIQKAIADTRRFARPQFVYRFFPLYETEGQLLLKDSEIDVGYPSLQKMFRYKDSQNVCILVSTLGIGIDNRIERLRESDMSTMVLTDACANALIEDETDEFQKRLGLKDSTFRYAPGYGDVPLSLQRLIFDGMPEIAKIGISLDEGCLMHPMKSMTGIIGFRS